LPVPKLEAKLLSVDPLKTKFFAVKEPKKNAPKTAATINAVNAIALIFLYCIYGHSNVKGVFAFKLFTVATEPR
jgi:hypothetical protein